MNSYRTRALGICCLALIVYGLVFHDTLDRRFAEHGQIFLVCAGLVIALTGLFLEPGRPMVRLAWATVSPFAASTVAYLAVQALIYSDRGYGTRGVSLGSWVFVSTVLPYISSGMWVLSLALPILSAVNHFLLNRQPTLGNAADP